MSAPLSPSPIAVALRLTADRIESGARYMWGHMGCCNCGHLAQTITKKSAAEIHRSALDENTGEWSEHLRDYCGASGTLIDDVTQSLIAFGFTRDELAHLEYLDDPRVLAQLGVERLTRYERDDVVRYLRAWASSVDNGRG
jgi:hypothetical protein